MIHNTLSKLFVHTSKANKSNDERKSINNRIRNMDRIHSQSVK